MYREEKTSRWAAVPMFTALGGKLKITTPTFLSLFSNFLKFMSLRTFLAKSETLSLEKVMLRSKYPDVFEWSCSSRGNSPSPLTTLLPPNTTGDIAPSSSGIATIMVFSTGSKPALDFSHSSRDWNSNGLAERYGTFNFARIDFAASESLYAGPPTNEKPVSDTSASIFFSSPE